MILRRKELYFFLLVIFSSFSAFGISEERDSLRSDWNPSLNIKFSPLPLLDLTPAVQIAAELIAYERHSLNAEYGYIFGIDGNDFSGNKFKLGYRYYFIQPGKRRGLFFGLQVMDKTVDVNTTTYAWSEDRTFQKQYDYQIKNHTQAFVVTSGYSFSISEKFTFEIMYGLGRRKLTVTAQGLPDGVEPIINFRRNIFNNVRFGVNKTPAIIINFKFGYLLFGEY